MNARRHIRTAQPALPGFTAPDPYLAWRNEIARRPRIRKAMPTAAERRLKAARRDPRQASIFGAEHTAELTSL